MVNSEKPGNERQQDCRAGRHICNHLLRSPNGQGVDIMLAATFQDLEKPAEQLSVSCLSEEATKEVMPILARMRTILLWRTP